MSALYALGFMALLLAVNAGVWSWSVKHRNGSPVPTLVTLAVGLAAMAVTSGLLFGWNEADLPTPSGEDGKPGQVTKLDGLTVYDFDRNGDVDAVVSESGELQVIGQQNEPSTLELLSGPLSVVLASAIGAAAGVLSTRRKTA